jgi:hypothetical protein
MKKLDFGFLQHDDLLEARVEDGNGFYQIGANKAGFLVTAYLNSKCLEIGKFPDIYEALDAANQHYNAPPITDRQKGFFKEHIYLVTGRYPLDTGENYTKADINAMFKLTYPAGAALYLDKEDNCWYLEKDGDGGWGADTEFAKKNIEKMN